MQSLKGLSLGRRRGGGGKRGDLGYSLRSSKKSPSLKRSFVPQVIPPLPVKSWRASESAVVEVQAAGKSGSSSHLGGAWPNPRHSVSDSRRTRIAPSLRTYFKVLPDTLVKEKGMEVAGLGTLNDSPEGGVESSPISQIELSPNRFQLQESHNLYQSSDSSRVSSQEGGLRLSVEGPIVLQDGVPAEKKGEEVVQQQEEVVPIQCQSPKDEPLVKSIAGMIQDLAGEVRGGIETSNTNQKEIRGLCETFGQKLDDLAERTAAVEFEVSDLRRVTEENREAIHQVKLGEESLQVKLETMENRMRRNNLRLLRVPEEMEKRDLKSLVVHLIKQGTQIEEEEEVFLKDIQRVHRDPFRKSINRNKPRKILACFHTYAIKERILVPALKNKTLTAEGINFEIRSDLSTATLNRQWELGKRIDVLKRLGATAQLKFPASLKVMANNKMYIFRDTREVDGLIRTLDKDYQPLG
ncbi:hypothetical protein NDU88_007108 [Pleurodeles waltl]|uniref:Uncharacterized protein n=1 Tax=Pleurodeles waltl TaxID=8319 RepID=A0AAV7RNG5_PLEWA|nr:hypothetical protein NDU88_007108 [Pleurodeles waltl]